ncbi:hypothetical protein HDU91_002818, partial [Kappamyces sp. JEL0680]
SGDAEDLASGGREGPAREPAVEASDSTSTSNDAAEIAKHSLAVFADQDFPELGKMTVLPPETEKNDRQPSIRVVRTGNQKQRREEKRQQDRVGASGTLESSIFTLEELKLPRHERYNGLMRKHEKELIAKIQISQLVSDDPFVDDFYFQMRSLAKKNEDGETATPLGNKPSNKKKGAKWQISAGQLVQGKTGAAISNQMQQQMKRLIESRRAQKPREGTLALEGALGKIAVKSNRAPKQAIQVAPSPSVKDQPTTNTLSSLADLRCAESIFDAVLKLEGLDRKKIPEDEELLEEHRVEVEQAKIELWRALAPSDQVPLATPHPLACALNHIKGLRAVNRGLARLTSKQNLGFFSVVFNRLECLNVCNYTLGKENDKVCATRLSCRWKSL